MDSDRFDMNAALVLVLAPGLGSKWPVPKTAVAAADWSAYRVEVVNVSYTHGENV
jgi:hypothetical protein